MEMGDKVSSIWIANKEGSKMEGDQTQRTVSFTFVEKQIFHLMERFGRKAPLSSLPPLPFLLYTSKHTL